MNSFRKNIGVFQALISRDFRLLTKNYSSMVGDCLPILFAQVITFGYLFHLFGMPSSMIAPIYLGSMFSLLSQIGFTVTLKTGFDLQYNRFIDYQMTLPLSKRWLFASFIVSNIIEVALATIPLFALGIGILHNHFDISSINWFIATGMYTIILIFFSTFFLAIGYTMPLTWIIDNIWPRVLAPLWWVSAGLMIWKKAYAFWPAVGYCMLFSPFTYVAEGMRSALIGGDQFIPWYICASVLIVFIGINCTVLTYGLKKKLDPV